MQPNIGHVDVFMAHDSETPGHLPIRAIKLGGSALESCNFAGRLRHWLRQQSAARNLVLVGGGGPVDAVRALAKVNAYDETFLHWLCIDLMDTSFQLLASLLPDLVRINSQQELERFLDGSPAEPNGACALVHVNAYYRRDNQATQPVSLPMNWDTTSDSLAALLAHWGHADELVLIKSCPIPFEVHGCDWQRLADNGIVDRAFPAAIKGLKRVVGVQLP
jgi:5-(aminomethyl)-3-furanmethanol phosphate kinase